VLEHGVVDQVEDRHEPARAAAVVQGGRGLAVRAERQPERAAGVLDDVAGRRHVLIGLDQVRTVGLLAHRVVAERGIARAHRGSSDCRAGGDDRADDGQRHRAVS
jgi:hypothetical protein